MKQIILFVAGLFKSKQEVQDMDRYIINHFNAGFQSQMGRPMQDAKGVFKVNVNTPAQVQDVSNELNAAGFRVIDQKQVD